MGRYNIKTFVLLLCLAATTLFGADNDANATVPSTDPVIIEDNSGVSELQLRQKANLHDTNTSKPPFGTSLLEDSNITGHEPSKHMSKSWEELSPTPKDGFDWIRTKNGDWLKGHIKSMYEEKLEFDSPEFGLYTFSLGDIAEIKSFGRMSVNIDNVAIFQGIIRYKEGKITIITGEQSYTFDKELIISITSAQTKERYFWSGDITLNVDVRSGNSDQRSGSLKVTMKRRTPKSRFTLDYLGRYSQVDGAKTTEDNRIESKYDRFVTKRFFVTPLFAEFYQNYFQNLKRQTTVGFGLGYTLVDTPLTEWYISSGPAYLATRFYEPLEDGSLYEEAFSFETSSRVSYKVSALNKIKFDYKFTLTDKKSGGYKHHTVLKLENDIIKERIFLDMSFIWDYIHFPRATDAYTPQNSDFQLLVGGGVKF